MMTFSAAGKTAVILVLAVSCVAAAAERREVDIRAARSVETRNYPVTTRAEAAAALAARKAGAPNEATASQFGQAPVLLQMYRLDTAYLGWAVATQRLPIGTKFTLIYRAPEDKQIQARTITFDADLEPGESFRLPDFRAHGVFWTQGVMVFDLFVDALDGTTTHCAVDFPVSGYARTAQEVREMVPLIRSASWERTNADGLVLNINGVFTASRPLIVLDDIVVPAAAILSNNTTTIRVRASAVPNLNPNALSDYLLTVGQDGWADTLPMRVVPN